MRPVLPRTDHNSWICSAHSVKGAKFVAVRIPQIGEIESARGALTCPGRIFDRGAAVLHARFMPSIGLGGILHHEADRAGVGVGGRLMVDRLCDHEATAPMGIDKTPLRVLQAWLTAYCRKQRVIEGFRALDVVAADHDMAEHMIAAVKARHA